MASVASTYLSIDSSHLHERPSIDLHQFKLNVMCTQCCPIGHTLRALINLVHVLWNHKELDVDELIIESVAINQPLDVQFVELDEFGADSLRQIGWHETADEALVFSDAAPIYRVDDAPNVDLLIGHEAVHGHLLRQHMIRMGSTQSVKVEHKL